MDTFAGQLDRIMSIGDVVLDPTAIDNATLEIKPGQHPLAAAT